MATDDAAARVDRPIRRGEDVLPTRFGRRARIFAGRACGSQTLPWPALRSWPWVASACSICTRSGRRRPSGSTEMRSFCPLPSRITTCRRANSTSFTRRRTPSMMRMPVPYRRRPSSACTPSSRPSTSATSSLVRTTGKPHRRLGALDMVEPRQLDREDFLVEEQQRALRLVLRAGGDVAHGGQMGEKRLDLARTHVGRVALAVKKDEAFNPVQIRLLGPQAVVLQADLEADTLEQRRLVRFGHRWTGLGAVSDVLSFDSGTVSLHIQCALRMIDDYFSVNIGFNHC